MKLSTRTQYGLRMLCQLAAEYEKGPMQMGEIVEREGISEKYLGQIMLVLRSSGLVSSVRGAQGGYYLGRAPDSVGLLEAVEILEGDILEFDDAAAGESSGVSDGRTMRNSANEIWSRVREAIVGVLSKYTLEDVVRQGLYKDGYLDFRI